MLNENDDLSWLPGETAAAMRDLARTVTEAPPLRLTADDAGLSPARRRRRPPGPRFRWSWGAPLLAAVTVTVLAIALVTVKDLPNGRVAPRVTSTAIPKAELPEYYVALSPASGRAGAPDGLVVGDTRTGKTVAVVAPPAGTTVKSVSAAADDRTFAVVTGPAGGGWESDPFYLLTIAPGSSPAARLTRLSVGPLTGVVIAAALSPSGKELAVAMGGESENRDLVVYSVTTGDAMQDWSTTFTTAIVPSSVVPNDNLVQFTQYPALSWIDGGRAIAFPELTKTGSLYAFDVRSISLATGGGDLMAYSKVIANLGSAPKSTGPCGTAFPVLSGNGTTLFCLMSGGPDGHTNPATVRWVLEWRPVQTRLANGAEWRSFAYVKIIGVPAGSTVRPATVWASSTGTTLLIEWSVVTSHGGTSVRFGEAVQGKNAWTYTPLPAPAILTTGGPPDIAWLRRTATHAPVSRGNQVPVVPLFRPGTRGGRAKRHNGGEYRLTRWRPL